MICSYCRTELAESMPNSAHPYAWEHTPEKCRDEVVRQRDEAEQAADVWQERAWDVAQELRDGVVRW